MAHPDDLPLPSSLLSVLSPSPSQEDNPVGHLDVVTFDVTRLPSDTRDTIFPHLDELAKRLKTLSDEIEEEEAKSETFRDIIYSDSNMKTTRNDFDAEGATAKKLTKDLYAREAKLKKLRNEMEKLYADFHATLACNALRVFVDAWLAEKGYSPDTCGPRKAWIEDNVSRLVPATCSSPNYFKALLLAHRAHGPDASAVKSLEVALAIESMKASKPDFRSMFIDCLGHTVDDEIDGRVPPTVVDAHKGAVARFVKTAYTAGSPTP